jgi:hypothetical protein
MLTLSAVQQVHGRLSRLPEFRALPPDSRRRVLQLITSGEIPQHEAAVMSAIEQAAIERKPENAET